MRLRAPWLLPALPLLAALGAALTATPADALPEGCREVLAPDRTTGQMRKRVVCPEPSRREERLERRVRELERRERRRSGRDHWDDDARGPAVIILPPGRTHDD